MITISEEYLGAYGVVTGSTDLDQNTIYFVGGYAGFDDFALYNLLSPCQSTFVLAPAPFNAEPATNVLLEIGIDFPNGLL